ncbi:sensor histidine kinase [Sinomonas mesophila]|uniref:sensor histidine kinase n=1 Tax=Sinomonas mesophila TaxID=1531955 RepID=UPI0009871030|nr:PAS domain-containing sensor histidine kinase [Sinomonas mesophila]
MTVSEQALVSRASLVFRRLGPRVRVAFCQLPLTAFVVVAVTTQLPAAGATAPWGLIIGLGLQIVLGIACLAVPWERLRDNAPLAIPLLDLVSIWILRNGEGQIVGVGNLAVFPVIWLAASTMRAAWVLPLSILAPLAIALPNLLSGLPNPTPGQVTGTIVLPLGMFTVAIAIRAAGAGLRTQARELERQRQQLRGLLDQAQTAERLLAAIFDAVDTGIVALSEDARPLRANRRFLSLLEDAGVTDGLMGSNLADLPLRMQDGRTPVSPDQHPFRRAADREPLHGEVFWLGGGDSARALSVRSLPLDGPNGGAVATFDDVTDLMRAVDAKAELVRTVAHEFRSPLTSVLGHVELVLDDPGLSQPAASRLGVAHASAERLLRLATDLLASSSERLPVSPVPTDLAETLLERAESAQLAAKAARIRIDVDVEDPLPAQADPFRIGQAVDNLLSNAIKYSPSGGTVTLSAHTDDGWITIGVADTGMGIRPEDQPRVFERFFRSDAARRAHIPGMGLGLAITRMIAERHGGELDFESEPERGSLFTLRIPAPS